MKSIRKLIVISSMIIFYIDSLYTLPPTTLHDFILMQDITPEDVSNFLQQHNRIDINDQDTNGRTPLWIATFYGVDPHIIDVLTCYGADMTIPDMFNVTPLHNAVDRNDIIVVKILLNAAIEQGLDILKSVISYKNDEGLTPVDKSDTLEMDHLFKSITFR